MFPILDTNLWLERCPTKKSVRSSLLYGLNMTRLSTELRNIKQRFAVLKVSNINNHDGSNLVCIGKSNTWVNLVVGFLACFFTGRNTIFKETVGWLAIWAKFKTEPNVDASALETNAFSFKN